VEVYAYTTIFAINLCYEVTDYALLAGGYCSGTETGVSRFFRICNESWFFLTLALDFTFLLLLLLLFQVGRVESRRRLIFVVGYLAYLAFIPLVWRSPFFLTLAFSFP